MRTVLVALLVSSACILGMPAESWGVSALASGEPDQQEFRAEVARLVEQLDDERFEVRQLAADELESLVGRAELGELLAGEFQRMLAHSEVSFEVRWRLEGWSRRLPDAPRQPVEEVSPEQVDRLLGQLDDDSYGVRAGAARRLESLLFTDANLEHVRQALETRLADEKSRDTAARLERLLELTRPAMVAECWRGRRHVSEQYLLVGVPSLGPGAERPSHFDRIDDREAHCVSGQSLPPGDYPVGVAIAHPKDPTAFFHLVNLPTPQRRLEYQQGLKVEEGERLAAISRRTLDRMLSQRRGLNPQELVMLGQLDPREVSRFAGEYFRVVDDGPLPRPEPPVEPVIRDAAGGVPSRFGLICAQLAINGTKEAIPGLLEAIDKDRFLPPTAASPCRLHWYAALSIAARDPWPEVNPWLDGLLGRQDLLSAGVAEGPRLGATAAAVLLERNGQSLSEFDLEKAAGPPPGSRFDGYRYASDAAQERIRQWWRQEQQKRD